MIPTQSDRANARLSYDLVRYGISDALASRFAKPIHIIEFGSDTPALQMDHLLCHTDEYVIFLVPELTHQALPFLKYADCLVFFHTEQARLFRDLYGDRRPYVVLDRLTPAAQRNNDSTVLNLIVPSPLTAMEYRRRALYMQSLLTQPATSVNLLSAASSQVNALLIEDLQKVLGPVPVHIVTDVAQWCRQGYTPGETLVLQPESLSPYDMPGSESLIGSNLFRLTSFCLRSRACELAVEILQDGPDAQHRAARIPNSVIQEIQRVCQNVGKSTRITPCPDTLESLNIVSGAPLSNRFVVSILFRNAGGKLLRAIDSVLRLANGYDVGVALVDDCSNDGSLETAHALLRAAEVDSVVVKNPDRKYAARNYYNVIHQLTCNNDSVIIDLDGDDHLNTEIDVFGVLERAYSDGQTLKTIGSYTLFSDAPQTSLEQSEFYQSMKYFALDNPVDLRRPWNIPTCPSWKHLRTSKRGLLTRVEVNYFLERSAERWLKMEHDISVHSRAIELALGRVKILYDKLYIYDVSGDNHDNHAQAHSKNCYIYQLYHAYTFDMTEPSITVMAPEKNTEELDVDYV